MEIFEAAKATPMKPAACRHGTKAPEGNRFLSVLDQVSRQPKKPPEENTIHNSEADPEHKEPKPAERSDPMENTSRKSTAVDERSEPLKTAEIQQRLKKQMESEGAQYGLRLLAEAIPQNADEPVEKIIPQETARPFTVITGTEKSMFEQGTCIQPAVTALVSSKTDALDPESGFIGKADMVPGQSLDQSKSSLTSQFVLAKESVTGHGLEIEALQKAYDAGKYQNIFNLRNSSSIPEAEASMAEPKQVQVISLPVEDDIPEMKQAITDETLDAAMGQQAAANKVFETTKATESGKEATLDTADLLSQIKSTSSKILVSGKQEFVIKLKPEGLGEITVRISENGGKLALSMVTSSLEVEKLLNSQLGTLRDALRPYHTEINSISTEQAPELTSQPKEGSSPFSQQQSGFADQSFRHDQENDKPLAIGRGLQIHPEALSGNQGSNVVASSILDQYV